VEIEKEKYQLFRLKDILYHWFFDGGGLPIQFRNSIGKNIHIGGN